MSCWIRCDGYFSEQAREEEAWFQIAEGRIAAIRPTPPEGVKAANEGDGKQFLLPLLSDTHVHCYMEPWPLNPRERVRPGSGTFEQEVEAGLARLRRALAMGLGFVRDMGDPLGVNLEIKRRIAADPTAFPALQVPGPAIHRPKRYGRFLGVKRETLPEILELIDELATEQQVDFIKVVTTGIVDFAQRAMNQPPQFTVEELAAVVERAAYHDLPVASHCSGADGIDINLAAGVSFIEHAYFVRDDQLDQLRAKEAFWTPTFAPVHQQAANAECGWDEETRTTIEAILADHDAAVTAGHGKGVQLLAGTDAGSPGVEMGGGLLVELERFARSLPPSEVLRLATAANADACGNPAYSGRLAVGEPASFALYRAAPWRDLGQLGQPLRVYQHGTAVSSLVEA